MQIWLACKRLTGLKETTEFEIYIGCKDSQIQDEIVSREELEDIVVSFFERNNIDFSLVQTGGGYLNEDGVFVLEDSLCISIIGDSDLDILGLAKSLSMYMNQETAMVVKTSAKSKIC